jgi:hypothetical protein
MRSAKKSIGAKGKAIKKKINILERVKKSFFIKKKKNFFLNYIEPPLLMLRILLCSDPGEHKLR